MEIDKPMQIALDEISEFMNTNRQRVPVRLHHFTPNVERVESILGNREMWASHAYDMNDPNEIRYGSELINSCLKRLWRRYAQTNFQTNQFFDMAIERSNPFTNDFNPAPEPFVISLCEDGGSASQWERYGNEGKGFCLNFAIDDAKIGSLKTQNLHLLPVIYDRQSQINLIDRSIRKQVSYLLADRGDPSAIYDGMACSIAFYQVALFLTSTFKAKEPWHIEREWRIVRGLNIFSSNEYHETTDNGKTRRFTKISLSDFQDAIYLHDISCGPNSSTPQVERQKAALSSYQAF